MARIQDTNTDEEIEFSDRLRVGRGPDNDLVLDEPSVSLQHATIRWRDGSFQVHDLGSSNGTRVDDVPVRGWRRLEIGDSIRFGPRCSWLVVDLSRTVRPAAFTTTEGGLQLILHRETPDGGAIQLTDIGQEAFLRARQPFQLLWILAERRRAAAHLPDGGWCINRDVKVGLYGAIQADRDNSRHALNKLVHDTRKMIESAGFDSKIIQRGGGRMRLNIPPDRITMVD